MEIGKTNQPLMPLRPPVPSRRLSVNDTDPGDAPPESSPQAQRPMAPPEQQAAAEPASEVSEGVMRNRVEQAVQDINAKIATSRQAHIKFSIDSDLGSVIVQVVDTKTDEVIRQIPPEEVVALQKRMTEMRGILFNKEG